MTYIEDMSETQRQAWITIIVDSAVFIYFLGKMMTGLSIDTLSPSGLSYLMIKVIIFTAIAHAIISGVFAARKRLEGEDEIKDERDIRIERKGNSYGFYFLAAFLYVIVGQILLQNGFDGIQNTGEDYGYKSVFDYKNTSHLIFALVAASFVADIIRNGVMVFAYQGHE